MEQITIKLIGESREAIHEVVSQLLDRPFIESYTCWGTNDGYTVDIDREVPKVYLRKWKVL